MRFSLTILTLITGLVVSASSHAAFVSSGAIAGADSGGPPGPPPASDIPLQPGHVPFDSILVGNLTNGCGLYKLGDDGPDSRAGTDCPSGVPPAIDLKKAIDYDTIADRISLSATTEIGLGIIVKEGHPERPDGADGRDQMQFEDFDIFLTEVGGGASTIFLGRYEDLGFTTLTDDAYYAGYFEGIMVPAGDYFLSFRVPGVPPSPGDIGDGGSVEFLARVSTVASVPTPPVAWLFIPGLLGLGLARRRPR